MANYNTPADLNTDLSRTNALPGQNYHPAETGALTAEQLGRGDDFYNSHLNYGVGGGGLMASQGNDPMVKALQGNYDKQSDTATAGIKARNEANVPILESNERMAAAGQANTEMQHENQNFSEQYAYQLKRQSMYNSWLVAKQKAAAQLTGQIFGGLGQVAGAVAGTVAGGGGGGGGGGESDQ